MNKREQLRAILNGKTVKQHQAGKMLILNNETGLYEGANNESYTRKQIDNFIAAGMTITTII